MNQHVCARCGDPIAAPYPVIIVGEPYHQACARSEEANRAGLHACQHCGEPFPSDQAVQVYGQSTIYCIYCWWRYYPDTLATLMSVVIAEQQQGADK